MISQEYKDRLQKLSDISDAKYYILTYDKNGGNVNNDLIKRAFFEYIIKKLDGLVLKLPVETTIVFSCRYKTKDILTNLAQFYTFKNVSLVLCKSEESDILSQNIISDDTELETIENDVEAKTKNGESYLHG